MKELAGLLLSGFVPSLLVALFFMAFRSIRAYAFRASRAFSLALTFQPIIVMVAAVGENTAASPDEGFATFLMAFILVPVVLGSWLATVLVALYRKKPLVNLDVDGKA